MKKCPMDKPVCAADCAWRMEDKCAVVVIAEALEAKKETKGGKK